MVSISQHQLLEVMLKAVASTREGITIADAKSPDFPLIYANKAFYDLTGYSPEEVIGFNCRFLQGEETELASVEKIKKCIKERKTEVIEIINYTKSGKKFWNRLSMNPIFDKAGEIQFFVGIQSDITLERELEIQKKQNEAMVTTMQTVNDLLLNYINSLQYFRFVMEDLKANSEDMKQFDIMYKDMAERMRSISSLSTYKHRSLDGRINVLDLREYN